MYLRRLACCEVCLQPDLLVLLVMVQSIDPLEEDIPVRELLEVSPLSVRKAWDLGEKPKI